MLKLLLSPFRSASGEKEKKDKKGHKNDHLNKQERDSYILIYKGFAKGYGRAGGRGLWVGHK